MKNTTNNITTNPAKAENESIFGKFFIPEKVIEYQTKEGKKRAIHVVDSVAPYGVFINAVNIAKNANRVKLAKLSKNGGNNIPMKLTMRDKALSAAFMKLVSNYFNLNYEEKKGYITKVFSDLNFDDLECAECVDIALVKLYEGITSDEFGENGYTYELIDAARSAVNVYLCNETKDADNINGEYSTMSAFISSDDGKNSLDKQMFINFIRDKVENSAETLFSGIEDYVKKAICETLKQMRKFEKIAVVTYGYTKSLYNDHGGKGEGKKTGFASIAELLNNETTIEKRTALYNSDLPKNVKQSAQYNFNTQCVRHAVEKFREKFTANYPELVVMLANAETWSALVE